MTEPTKPFPQSVDEAAASLLLELSPDQRLWLAETPRKDLELLHLAVGWRVRERYSLTTTQAEALLQDVALESEEDTAWWAVHPNEASEVIVERMWEMAGEG